MLDVSIIIVTWNALDHVDACLAAIRDGGADGVAHEVIVVDNASTDSTVAHVRSTWPDVQVIATGRNGGMAAGNNVGMLAAKGRSFLLLNSDAFLEPGSLRRMLDRLDAATDTTAAVVPRLQYPDGSPQRSVRGFPTTWRYATEFLGIRKLAPRTQLLNAFYAGGLDLRAPQDVDWATGACLLVPRAAVDEVGLMDEAFFMYGEEVDWLWRMRDRGRRVAWEPGALVVHVGGGSSQQTRGALYQRQLANHVRTMSLHAGVGAARRTRWIMLLALRLRALLLPAGRREAARAGVATVRATDPRHPEAAVIPSWPALEQEAAAPR
ncbi:MAG: glycosyl transferase, family 2 [Thermoleophilia bacterium]|nr:glycosyl transferase, family 2 [Thermoleophilia bacterium]MCZ4495615.1 glycosyl transferase, family 2 [Thermoleophilia bacterium]